MKHIIHIFPVSHSPLSDYANSIRTNNFEINSKRYATVFKYFVQLGWCFFVEPYNYLHNFIKPTNLYASLYGFSLNHIWLTRKKTIFPYSGSHIGMLFKRLLTDSEYGERAAKPSNTETCVLTKYWAKTVRHWWWCKWSASFFSWITFWNDLYSLSHIQGVL